MQDNDSHYAAALTLLSPGRQLARRIVAGLLYAASLTPTTNAFATDIASSAITVDASVAKVYANTQFGESHNPTPIIPAPASDTQLSLTPSGPLDFGEVASGKTTTIQLLLSNKGKKPVKLTGFDGLAAPFSVDQDCDNPLKSGSSCELTVSFGPSESDVAKGAFSASLLISANVGVTGSPLLLKGTAKAGPAVSRPDPFRFSPFSGAQTHDLIESSPVTISGITRPIAISIVGASYSITRGGVTMSLGTADSWVKNNDVVRITLRASSTPNTTKSATLTIGGVTADFLVTTAPAFIVPAKALNSELGVLVTTKTKIDPLSKQTKQDLLLTVSLTPASFGAAAINSFAGNGISYKLFIAAILPPGAVGAPKIAVFLKDLNSSWVGVGSPLAAYLENVLINSQDSQIKINVLQDFDFALLRGVEFYIGYGISDAEMISAGRYRGFYKVP